MHIPITFGTTTDLGFKNDNEEMLKNSRVFLLNKNSPMIAPETPDLAGKPILKANWPE